LQKYSASIAFARSRIEAERQAAKQKASQRTTTPPPIWWEMDYAETGGS